MYHDLIELEFKRYVFYTGKLKRYGNPELKGINFLTVSQENNLQWIKLYKLDYYSASEE